MPSYFLRVKFSPDSKQEGATMIEAALVITVLVIFFAELIGLGLGIYHYSLLNYAIDHSMRIVTASSAKPYTCTELKTLAESTAKAYYTTHLGQSATGYTVKSSVALEGSASILTLSGNLDYTCFMCGIAGIGKLKLGAQSQTELQRSVGAC